MSIALMAEAWKTTLPTSRKIVLLALCDNANDMGVCYPSIPMIAAKCSLKERAVYQCLGDLERDGFLKRDARIGRSTIYRIENPGKWGAPASYAPLHYMQGGDAPNAGVKGVEPLHYMHPTPAPYAPTPAYGAPITINEPSVNRIDINPLPPFDANSGRVETVSAKQSKKSTGEVLPDWLPVEAWEAFIAHRKAMKSAMTPHAQKLTIKKLDELRRLGDDPEAVINQAILNGWKGVFPIRDSRQQNHRKSVHDDRAETIAVLTGRSRSSGETIDITPYPVGGG